MAKIIKKTISWTASTASDVVSHKVYTAKEVDGVSYNSPNVEVPMPDTQIILPDAFPSGTFGEDTNYLIGITAVDDVGNESDMVEVSAPFDFIAPDAPTGVTVSDL